jgi:hypothetical protein
MNVANEIERYKKSGEAFKDQTKRLKAEERKETWKGIGTGALMGAAGVAGVAALPVIAPLVIGGAVVNRVLSGGANNPTLGRDNKSKSGNF